MSAVLDFELAEFTPDGNFALSEIGSGDQYMLAETGLLEMRGGSATLTYVRNYRLVAEPGRMEFRGGDVTPIYTSVVFADIGLFEFRGGSATLTVSPAAATYTLTAERGNMGMAGADAALLYGRRLGAQVGAMEMVGGEVTFGYLRSIVLNAEAGRLEFVGSNATLAMTGHYVLRAETGELAFAGQSATLLRDRRLPAEPGSLEMQGSATLTVVRAHRLLAEAGVLEMRGGEVTLSVGPAFAIIQLPPHVEDARVAITVADAVLDDRRRGRAMMLQLDPEADGKNTVRFHKAMLEGEEIASATAKLQERTATRPETWADVAAEGLTVTATVVDARDDKGVLIRERQAVQCMAVDADNNTYTPARGTGYRWLVVATITGRDVPLVGKNPVTLRP